MVGTIVAAFVLLTINFRTHMRPELFAFLLFVVALILLHEFLVSGRLRWLVGLLPVGLVWANTHGSFLVGLGLIPMVLAGLLLDDWRNGELGDPLRRRTRIRRRYLPLAAAALLLVGVSLITPHGVELFRQAFVIGQADFIRENILEFAPTFGEQMRGRLYVKIYVVFLSVVALSFAVARKRVSAVSVVLFVVFGYLSVDAVRYTAWFAVASAYVLARNLRGAPSKRDSRTALAVIASLVLLGSVATVLERGNVMGKPLGFEDMSPLPSEAIEFIEREGIQGNVFNAYRFGDQLVYQFYPRIRVVIDSRNDAYGERYYLQYRSLSGRSFKRLAPAEELVGFLDRYRIDTIVTLPHDFRNWEAKGYLPPLERAGWEVTFDRSDTLVLQRRGAAP